MLTIKSKEMLGGARQFPVVRCAETPGTLTLRADIDDSSWLIRVGLDAGTDSAVTISSSQEVGTFPIHPLTDRFDGRPFPLPRPSGFVATPERIRFEHPFSSALRCEIQIYNDAPVPQPLA